MVLAHGTNHPLLHIINYIIIIHIIHIIIIFLFQPISTNLIAYFPIKSMGIFFLHYWTTLPCLKSLVLLPISELHPLVLSFQPTLTIAKPYKYAPNRPLKSIYFIINHPNLLNISIGIPIGC